MNDAQSNITPQTELPVTEDYHDKQKPHKSTINSSSIPPGYKQTEVGVVPEDWEVSSLNEICTKITEYIAIWKRWDFRFQMCNQSILKE
jgi:hypothetical protein